VEAPPADAARDEIRQLPRPVPQAPRPAPVERPRRWEAPSGPAAALRRAPSQRGPVRPERGAAPDPAIQQPNITLQVVVFSDVPSQRMAFIDGRRYAEGDQIDADTVLERIDADGIVVRWRGARFAIAARRD
jgi:general secretion pathway protein B